MKMAGLAMQGPSYGDERNVNSSPLEKSE